MISFIIVNYNTKDLLDKCVAGLLEINVEKEVIVVDNASWDGSAQMIEEKYGGVAKVVLIKSSENVGIAASHNLALQKARGEYLIFLGTDAYPTEKNIMGLLEFMDVHTDVGIASPKLVLRDGSMDKDAHRGFPTPWTAITHFSYLDRLFPKIRLFNGYYLGSADFSKPHEIDVCICHFMFVRREAQDKVGLWDEDYFVYGEDVDFCYRIKQAGFKIMFVPDVEVLHYKGATVGRKTSIDIKTAANTSDEVKQRMLRETTRAMRLFYEKHYAKIYPKWLTGLVILGITLLGKLRIVLGVNK